jgi:hypothetical protein
MKENTPPHPTITFYFGELKGIFGFPLPSIKRFNLTRVNNGFFFFFFNIKRSGTDEIGSSHFHDEDFIS